MPNSIAEPSSSRLILGTAQLGMPYGIANKTGAPAQSAVNAIVGAALDGGVQIFDTAQGYGGSEAALGEALRAHGPVWPRPLPITKLRPDLAADGISKVPGAVRASLDRLAQPTLYGLMLHREEHLPLLDGPLGPCLARMRAEGLFERFGVSVYTPQGAAAALNRPEVAFVQLPASLFDRRFAAAGVFRLAREKNKLVHIRSVLLQGVLCLEPEELPPGLAGLADCLARFRLVCRERGLSPAQLALMWVLHSYPDAYVLFGAESAGQAVENCRCPAALQDVPQSVWRKLEALVPPQLPELLNPALWNLENE